MCLFEKRYANGDLTSYGYDIHGRLTSAKSVSMKKITGEIERDYSTSYTYDKNANITSLFRKGITDIIGGQTRLFGAHTDIYMGYTGNQIRTITAVGQGADYEGRTGLGTQTPGRNMAYDANGNLRIDESRNIVQIKYNRRNLPTEVTFGDGHRQTVTYDGFGRKLRVDYSQVPEALLRGGMEIFSDNLYELTSSREYVGPYVFSDGKLEYSAFGGGYFDPDKGAMYYVTDWQGNNAAVVDKDGIVMQRTIYYPYGEPTIEPTGQRYLFGGKEREHAGGRNSYDFGARSLTPYGSWGVIDPLAEKYYPFSPYTYCGGDPINYIDKYGLEKSQWCNDSISNIVYENIPDVPSELLVIAHGDSDYIQVKNNEGQDFEVRSPDVFINMMETSFDSVNPETFREDITMITLCSCNTGRDPEEGGAPIAQKISRGLPNAFIKAPNGIYNLRNKVKIEVLKEEPPKGQCGIPVTEKPWRYFHNGKEIDKGRIPLIIEIIRFNKNIKIENAKILPTKGK